MTPILVRVKRASALLDRGQTNVRRMVKEGELEGVKSGNLLMITVASIHAYVARLPKAGTTPPPAAAMRAHAERRQKRAEA
ncbi:helix-turn-helix domain-containing protein [Roseomonas sp. CAU 1739]|uniref:helix-turn-helix domain-containing protein n=1 Tax=Roseomonas sp. CAU 1739 TaxID=3140364 RepID=UPI00325BF9C3